jgi:hypothetical protein
MIGTGCGISVAWRYRCQPAQSERCYWRSFGQVWSQVLDHYPQKSAFHVAIFHQAVHHPSAEVRRNRKANSLISLAARQDRRIDAYQPYQSAIGVDQRTTGVTGIDRRISLYRRAIF